jgi:hypothetical protein
MERARELSKEREPANWELSDDPGESDLKFDWAKCFKDFVKDYKRKEGKMRKYYIELKNRQGKVVIIICGIQQDNNAAYGMAIRSKEDEHDVIDGNCIAFARAVRALKGRKPCYTVRKEVQEAIWSLTLDDFRKFLFITGGCVDGFPKGSRMLSSGDTLSKFIEGVKNAA